MKISTSVQDVEFSNNKNSRKKGKTGEAVKDIIQENFS